MGYGSWFRRQSARFSGGRSKSGRARNRGLVKSSYGRRARIEELESRRVLATFLVTNLDDTFINDDDEVETTAGSLRAAVEAANAGANGMENVLDIILFADGLAGTINLNNGELPITQPVRILGPGPLKLAVSADAGARIFNTEIGDEQEQRAVEISGLTLAGGQVQGGDDINDSRGGAILNRENLTMTEVILQGNSAIAGGGAIYHLFGNLQISRSLLIGNSAGGIGGGAILVGTDEDAEVRPRGQIINSTITGNNATSEDDNQGYGGGILVRKGRFEIFNNTFVDNAAAGAAGGGVASWGNTPPPDPESDPPPATAETTIQSNILFFNLAADAPQDIAIVGPPVVIEEMDVELETSIENLGFNDIGVAEMRVTAGPSDIADDPLFISDQDGIPILGDFGGSTPVFLPDTGSPVIDAGFADPGNRHEQRGRHFVRAYTEDSDDGVADIGAAEVQKGVFIVDIIVDESDGQFADVSLAGDPYLSGDFAIREALDFSSKNPEVDTIQFSDALRDAVDPTLSPAPTLLLIGGELVVDVPVFIEGPTNWLLEIDASGNDPTPLINNNDGSRVFNISDGVAASLIDVSISDLTVMGGDVPLNGGGLLSLENLTLARMTVKDSNASTRGGGIYARYGTLDIDRLTVNNNRAADDGGGLYIDVVTGDPQAPDVVIRSSTISGNTAADRAGGIGNNGGKLLIEYSTIHRNSSGSLRGGGIVNFAVNVTTGGTFLPTTELRSTIVSGNPFNANSPNSPNNDVEFFNNATASTFTSLGYNLIGGGNAVAAFNATGDQTNVHNPRLDVLAITGGLLATHRPQLGSAAIDMGDPAALPAQGDTPEFDERGPGFTRVYDGDNNGSVRIDIGAYELQPSMLVVDNPGDVDDGNLTPGNVTLREAINLSNINPIADTIVFDITMLPPTLSVNASTLAIRDTVTIIGPGSGVLAISSGVSDRLFTIDNLAATLIDVKISGLQMSNGTFGAMLSRENTTLDDITFLSNSATTAGGAVFHQTGTFKLLNSLVTGNSTSGLNADGGAIYLLNAPNSEIVYTTIAGNSATMTGSDGGALFIKGSTVTITGSTITGNSTTAGTADGGGLFVDSSTVLFEESAISGNITIGGNSEGAGLHVIGASSVVTIDKNSILSANSTFGSQAPGGGAYVSGGTLVISNSLVSQNSTFGNNSSGGAVLVTGGGTLRITGTSVLQNQVTAIGANGGGVANLGGNLLVRSSTFTENSANHSAARGGGIYTDTNLAGTQTTTILNSTISGNSAPQRGGGVFNADGRTDIKHSTITNNSTGFMNAGSGVASAGNSNTLTTVQSSIIAGNVGASAGTGSDIDYIDAPFVNSIQSLGHNVIGIGNALASFSLPNSGDKINIANPLLAPLTFNGGLTATHALLAGSPAINAGNPGFNPNAFSPALTTDQRGPGFARVQGGRIDVGAFESSFTGLSADFDSDGDADGADFLAWQRGLGTANPTKANGDANGDGVVNGADLTQWRGQFGASVSEAAFAPAAVSGIDPDDAPAFMPTLQLVAESGEAAAAGSSSGASEDVSSVAGVGTPAAGGSSRGSRPAARSADAPQLAAVAVHAAAFDSFSTDQDGFSPRARSRFVAADADGDVDASAEDALFALLGDASL